MADSVGTTESAWGWLHEGLKSVGQTVIEAGADRLAGEIRRQDSITQNDEPQPKLTTAVEAPVIDGQAVRNEGAFMGTLRSINPTHAMLAVAALGGLLLIARRL